MASPTTPMHGKLAAMWRLRPNNFKGSGLNDLAWGTGFNGAASAYFEVVVDGTGTPDTFKWRKDGGAWTEDVAIIGAAQTLSDGQTVTFAATTGHTLNDQWVTGNLKDEATTESGATAQITDSTKRILNPNSPPTFTDDGGKNVLIVDFTRGQATFDGNVGNVDVDGNNGYIVRSGLEQVGYLIDWTLNINLDVADASRQGQKWKEFLPGLAGGTGSAMAYFLGEKSFLTELQDGADNSQKYYLIEFYNYDPDQDQTGDHMLAWAVITGIGVNAPLNEAVKETVNFQVQGIPSFVANA